MLFFIKVSLLRIKDWFGLWLVQRVWFLYVVYQLTSVNHWNLLASERIFFVLTKF